MKMPLQPSAVVIGLLLLANPADAWHVIQDGALLYNKGGDGLLLDALGDVISTGMLGSDDVEVFVLKNAASTGSEIWRYQATLGCQDRVMAAVAIDSQGYIVAVGGCRDSSLTRAAFVAKLDPADGYEVWRSDIRDGHLVSVAVDSSDNVIAAGSWFGASNEGFFALKLDGESGSELWRSVINGAADNVDTGLSVAVDHMDDPIISGLLYDRPAFSHPDFTVFKLAAADGSETWRFSIDSVSAHGGTAEKVVIDTNGDVIAAGQAVLVDWCDLVVVKVANATGGEIWRAVLDEPTIGSCDAANTIELDINDDVLVAAKPSVTIYSVIKYSGSTGVELWRTDIPNICACTGGNCAGAHAVASDSVGDVVATGKLAGCSDITTLKLGAADGSEVWRVDFDLDECDDYGTELAVDADGDVVVGGIGYSKIDGLCSWPQGSQYVLQKLTGPSGIDYWEGCSDERDNDGDGLVDYPADIGCKDPSWPTENPECSDGVDNADSDDPPLADWDGAGMGSPDPNCVAPWDKSETPTPPRCGLGSELAVVLLPITWLRRRRWVRRV
jgi:hypothetical protein